MMTKLVSGKTTSLVRAAWRGKWQSKQVALLLLALLCIYLDGANNVSPNDTPTNDMNDYESSTVPKNNRILQLNEENIRRAGEERRLNMTVRRDEFVAPSPPTSTTQPPIKVTPKSSSTMVEKVNDQGMTEKKEQKTNQVVGIKAEATNHKVERCCFQNSRDYDWNQEFTPEFFESIRAKNPQVEWSGNEYEEWLPLYSHLSSSNDCQSQWALLVLTQVKYRGEYLRKVMTQVSQGRNFLFSFYPEQEQSQPLPRILFLGDSISLAIWTIAQRLYNPLGVVALHGAPTNCRGFDKYIANLNLWLGSCPWDVVQFNVGLHFSPTTQINDWQVDYEIGIRWIVSAIRAHSPQAKIIFALTTPSPFDSPATIPDGTTCPHGDLFHKKGFISSMNEIARSLSKRLGILINDRYSAILPLLSTYQKPCNVHFEEEGYHFLARHDWDFLSSHLNISVPEKKTKITKSVGLGSTPTAATAGRK
jgi:hypothetical protein